MRNITTLVPVLSRSLLTSLPHILLLCSLITGTKPAMDYGPDYHPNEIVEVNKCWRILKIHWNAWETRNHSSRMRPTHLQTVRASSFSGHYQMSLRRNRSPGLMSGGEGDRYPVTYSMIHLILPTHRQWTNRHLCNVKTLHLFESGK